MKTAKSLKIRDLSFKYCKWERPVLGLSVSTSYGNAVKRNRFKRRCRELFKKYFINRNLSIALIVRPSMQNIKYTELNFAFNKLCEQIHV